MQNSIYSIRDTVDTFSVRRTDTGAEVILNLEDGTTESITVENEFRGFLYIVAQMFFDHEHRFEDVEEPLMHKMYPIFDDMFKIGLASK